MAMEDDAGIEALMQGLFAEKAGLKVLLEKLVHAAMAQEVEAHVGVRAYQRDAQRHRCAGVIRGLTDHPIVLLTNVPSKAGRNHAEWIADIYLTRWKCEEAYRFIKQSYHLEDVRVRSYAALRNTYVLVHAVFYFVSVVIGTKAKLNLVFKKVCEKARRFYGIERFNLPWLRRVCCWRSVFSPPGRKSHGASTARMARRRHSIRGTAPTRTA